MDISKRFGKAVAENHMAKKQAFCKNCGNDVGAHETVCKKCGAPSKKSTDDLSKSGNWVTVRGKRVFVNNIAKHGNHDQKSHGNRGNAAGGDKPSSVVNSNKSGKGKDGFASDFGLDREGVGSYIKSYSGGNAETNALDFVNKDEDGDPDKTLKDAGEYAKKFGVTVSIKSKSGPGGWPTVSFKGPAKSIAKLIKEYDGGNFFD